MYGVEKGHYFSSRLRPSKSSRDKKTKAFCFCSVGPDAASSDRLFPCPIVVYTPPVFWRIGMAILFLSEVGAWPNRSTSFIELKINGKLPDHLLCHNCREWPKSRGMKCP